MPKFDIIGAHRETGNDVRTTLEANNMAEAQEIAWERAICITKITQRSEPVPPPPNQTIPKDDRRLMSCADCGAMISPRAATCPRCGAPPPPPTGLSGRRSGDGITARTWLGATAIAVVLIVAGIALSSPFMIDVGWIGFWFSGTVAIAYGARAVNASAIGIIVASIAPSVAAVGAMFFNAFYWQRIGGIGFLVGGGGLLTAAIMLTLGFTSRRPDAASHS